MVPTFNEESTIRETLRNLQPLRGRWLVVVSDGGSTDHTRLLAKPLADVVIESEKGRANQLNAGATKAKRLMGEEGVLVFLHADTQLPESFEQVMAEFVRSGKDWGRFDVNLSGVQPTLRLIEWMMNHRSRLTGIATGDQAMFFRTQAFTQLGGFPSMPLMEDVEMSRLAKRTSWPHCPTDRVVTSSRKWEREGVIKTMVLMWFYRAAYFLGVSANQIHRWYYR